MNRMKTVRQGEAHNVAGGCGGTQGARSYIPYTDGVDASRATAHDPAQPRSIAGADASAYHVRLRRKEHGREKPIINAPSPNELLSDLLARCALGDQKAFARLYQETSGKLYGVAMHILRDSRAEEVLQDAFVKIWHRASDYRPDKGSPMAWMASIVRNRSLDMLRRPDLESPVEDQDAWEADEPGPLDQTLQRAEARALLRCLEQLDNVQRQVMTLAFFHGLAHAELARRVEQPLGTVKSWIRRGLQRLRGCLEL